MATHMPSSLEIAQEASLRPIADIAEEAGLESEEYDLYGKYKAKVDLSVLERLPGKTIILGVLDLGAMTIEAPDVVAQRIRAALKYVSADRLVVAPDCGMKYLPRDVAFGKLRAMVDGTKLVRAEIGESE